MHTAHTNHKHTEARTHTHTHTKRMEPYCAVAREVLEATDDERRQRVLHHGCVDVGRNSWGPTTGVLQNSGFCTVKAGVWREGE